MDRRTTIKWVLAAGAALPSLAARAQSISLVPSMDTPGYGTDPHLLKEYRSGELWPLTLTEHQRRSACALCDTIIPADVHSPSATDVGVVDFIDEWVSAPYPVHRADRSIVLAGLQWLDAESQRRFRRDFSAVTDYERETLCDDICDLSKVPPEMRVAAEFFKLYRDLTAGGFYTTPAGRKDLGYVGNRPQAQFDGPPTELLVALGLLGG